MNKQEMQQAFTNIGGVKTKVVTWGIGLEELQKKSSVEDIVVMIPGNPGVTRFYTMFLQTIYEQLKWPIVIIGHAGHEINSNSTQDDVPSLKGHEHLYGMQGQVEHKKEFFQKYIPETARVHFIGHSIGTYTILQLLKDPSIKSRVVKSYMLFPTIEYMSDTTNGKFLTKIVYYILWLIYFLSWIFTLLPSILQTSLVYLYLRINCIPKMHLKTIVNFINPEILQKVFFMAYEEMDLVKARDDDVIKENVKKLKFYYGASDGWTPVAYYNKLKEDFPELDAELCVRKFDHSYVLRTSRDVGSMVAKWLKE